MKKQLPYSFEKIISAENLLDAWREFARGKRDKPDVQDFHIRFTENILLLRSELMNGIYRHGGYEAFTISDPKQRHIHKASVRDRLLHHAIYRVLYQFFDKAFIADSFSCRIGKGTYAAINRFRHFHRRVSKNDTRSCWALKCDVKKFFANIDHAILMGILARRITDGRLMALLGDIIGSFSSLRPDIGLPLGNLTSQLLVNIYMNEFDLFVKHALGAKQYLRYADDFAVLSDDREWLEGILPHMDNFLRNRLGLTLHPDKVFIKTLASGVDVLGWVHFHDHRVLRTTTRRRAMRRLTINANQARVASYLGMLRHGNAYKIREKLLQRIPILPHLRQHVGWFP